VTVGGDPDVVIIQDSNTPTEEPVERLDEKTIRDVKSKAREIKEKIADMIFGST